MVARLEDENEDVRLSAASALGRLGPLPEEVLERVRGLVEDEGGDRDVRYWAARVVVAEEEREGA